MLIRPLVSHDLPHLQNIDANFTSDRFLDVRKSVDGFSITWQLIERPLNPPFVSTDYNIPDTEIEELADRLRTNDGLYLAVEDEDKLIAFLDMPREHWRNAALISNLYVDQKFRRRGVGAELINRAVHYAQENSIRAIWLETQSNNYPACQFYRSRGFEVCGLDDHFYSNEDMALKEVALFWWKEIN
ncbi:MAG TPA: GNAT family N-acetyltransferase [Anaerolineae bacterium]|nr:GNAT family N-acetyltransferase [Anaerolineae bacterium]